MNNYLRAIWLFLRLFWRYDMTDTRMNIGTAWRVAHIIWLEPVRKYPNA